MMDIEYDFKKSIKQIALENGLDQKEVSQKFKRWGYDHKKDHEEYLHREIVKYFEKHPNATIKEVGLKFGIKSHNTILKYKSPDYVYNDRGTKKVINKSRPILSVGNSDQIILTNILKLYLPKEITFDCDLTFGEGGFYKKGIKAPKYKFDAEKYGDLSPVGYDVIKLEKAYELEDSSLKSIIIDPPSKIDPNKTDYNSFKSMGELYGDCSNMIDIAKDKLRKNGIMVIKTHDYVLRNDDIAYYDGEWVGDFLISYAVSESKFDLIDKFILVTSDGIMSTSAKKSDMVKKYAFYLVFKKVKV